MIVGSLEINLLVCQMDYNEIPTLKQCCFVWWNNHVFSIIQHWFLSLLHRLSQTFTNSVYTFQWQAQTLHISNPHGLTQSVSPHLSWSIRWGRLWPCVVSIYWLDSLDGPEIWLSSSLIQDTSALLSWSCAGAGGCALSGGLSLPEGGPPLVLDHFSRSTWSSTWWCRWSSSVSAHRTEGMQICSFLVKN